MNRQYDHIVQSFKKELSQIAKDKEGWEKSSGIVKLFNKYTSVAKSYESKAYQEAKAIEQTVNEELISQIDERGKMSKHEKQELRDAAQESITSSAEWGAWQEARGLVDEIRAANRERLEYAKKINDQREKEKERNRRAYENKAQEFEEEEDEQKAKEVF